MQARLDVGAVLRRVFAIYVEQAPVLMPAAAVVFVFTGILSTLLSSSGAGLGTLALLISLVATTVFTGVVVELVADVRDGRREVTAGRLLQAVTPVIGQLLAVALAAAVGVLIGLLALVVPGLVLITLWSLAAPVVVIERPPGLQALRRSRELVRGNAWQVFAVILLLDVLVAVIAAAIELAAASAGTGAGIVATVVLGVLGAPFAALGAAVMYFELRAASSAGADGSPAADSGTGGY